MKSSPVQLSVLNTLYTTWWHSLLSSGTQNKVIDQHILLQLFQACIMFGLFLTYFLFLYMQKCKICSAMNSCCQDVRKLWVFSPHRGEEMVYCRARCELSWPENTNYGYSKFYIPMSSHYFSLFLARLLVTALKIKYILIYF